MSYQLQIQTSNATWFCAKYAISGIDIKIGIGCLLVS